MKVSKGSRHLIAFSAVLVSLLTLLMSEGALHDFEVDAVPSEEFMVVPKAAHVKPFLLGHEALVADLTWVRLLGYFADEVFGRKKFTYLDRLIDFATDLDPRFEKIYMWAGAVLMYNTGSISREKIQASTQILEKGWRVIQNDPVGWRHHPQVWSIPQMIGFNYAIELGDRAKGAPYIEAAARIPGSPALLKTWAATLYKKSGSWEQGTRFLEDMLAIETLNTQLENTKETQIQNEIRNRLGYYYSHLYGRDAAEHYRFIEERIRRSVGKWRETLPYVPYGLFLVLRPDEEEEGEMAETRDLWGRVFPLTAQERS